MITYPTASLLKLSTQIPKGTQMYSQSAFPLTMDLNSFNPWNRGYGASRYSAETSPFLTLHGQMNRLVNDFMHDFAQPRASNNFSTRWPNVEVSETEKEIRILAELPGIDEKDIVINLRDGVLTLTGEKKAEGNGSVYSERLHGKFERSIQLGSEIDSDKVTASFKHGVLTIAFAKRPDAQKQVKRISLGR